MRYEVRGLDADGDVVASYTFRARSARRAVELARKMRDFHGMWRMYARPAY